MNQLIGKKLVCTINITESVLNEFSATIGIPVDEITEETVCSYVRALVDDSRGSITIE